MKAKSGNGAGAAGAGGVAGGAGAATAKAGKDAAKPRPGRGGGPLSSSAVTGPALSASLSKISPPSEISENPEPPRKRPGRPKGLPKTGGRVKNKPSKMGKEAREYLAKHSNYLETISRICAGKAIKMAGPTGKQIYWYPEWSDRRWALEIAVSKLLPTMAASEISGPDQEPLIPQVSDREWARRLAWLLTKPGSGGEGTVAELMEGSSRVSPAPAVPKNGKTPPGWADQICPAPESGDLAHFSENFSPKKTKSPMPKTGEEALIGEPYLDEDGGTWHAVKVRNIGPVRDGPDRFVVLDGGLIVNNAGGDYDKALAWARERFNLTDAPVHIEAVGPEGPEPVRPDQMPFAVGGIEITRGYPERKN